MTSNRKEPGAAFTISAMLICAMCASLFQQSTAHAIGTLCGGLGEAPCCDCCNCPVSCLCGFCDCECDAGLVESLGFCYPPPPCGGDGEICCEPNCSCDNQWLQQYFGFCGPCGGDGEPFCISGTPCQPGLVNLFGFCAPLSACGGDGQPPCTSGDPCDPWHQLVLGVSCAACGSEGYVPCLPDVSITPGCQNNLVLTGSGTCEVFCEPSAQTCNATDGATTSIWPGGTLYYEFESAVASDSAKVQLAKEAMDLWSASSANITFLPRNGEADYIKFFVTSGNNADVGVGPGGERSVNLGSGWGWLCLAVHELGHSVGMWHEQSRPDRDDYVYVIWENVSGGCSNGNFAKVPQQYWLYYQPGQYDYASIMHYGACFQSTCSDEFGQCPCTFGVCDFEDTSICPNAGMTLVAKSCDAADQSAIRDWGEGCLTSMDEFKAVQLYGTGVSIYLEAGASSSGADGGVAHPYPAVVPAGSQTPGANIWIKGGTYAASAGTYNTPGVWRAHNGVAQLE